MIVVSITVFAAGLVILWPAVQVWLLAATTTLSLLVTDGAWRPLQWTTRAPERQDYMVTSLAGRELHVRLYRPRRLLGRVSVSAMVINTPFIGGGVDDPRLTNIGETMARAGFIVAVPWREQGGLLVSSEDTEDVIAAAEFVLDQVPPVKTLGLFGISYGVGPVFAAAADQRLADKVSFIISLNGYSELATVIDFITSGQSHAYPREVFEANLTARGQTSDVYLASADFQELNEALSPIKQLTAISADLFIIHSTADTFIPFGESVRLQAEASEQLYSSLFLTDVIDHGPYRPLTFPNLLRYYLPAGRDFTAAMTEILRAK